MISIIIPCKDHSQELLDCLTGIQKLETGDIDYEVIVVDSANDPAVQAAAAQFPQVRVISSPDPLGPGDARNLGAAHAEGEHLAFIDADCVPDPHWLSAIRRAFQDAVVMVGGAVLTANRHNLIAVCDNIIQFNQYLSKRPHGKANLLPGCNLAVEKEVFDTIGGFPGLFIGEDSLLSQKISEKWPERSVFNPEMVVSHYGRSTLASFYTHQFGFGKQRGLLGIEITSWQQNLGRRLALAPFVVFRRVLFIYGQILRWEPLSMFYYLALLPLMLYGLTGWALGFRKGCIQAWRATK